MNFQQILDLCKEEVAKMLGVEKYQIPRNEWWDRMSTFAEQNAGDKEVTEDDLRRDFRELVEDVIDQKKGE